MNNWKEVLTTYSKLKDLEDKMESLNETTFIEEVRSQIATLLDTYDPTEADRFLKDNYIMV